MVSVAQFCRAILCFVQFRLDRKTHVLGLTDSYIAIKLDSSHLHRYVLGLSNLLNQGEARKKLLLPLDFVLLSKLHEGRNWRPYNTALLTNEMVEFRPTLGPTEWKNCSIDYFSESAIAQHSYRIPIGPHPLFWTWQHPPSSPREKTAFFAGAGGVDYNQFNEILWEIPSRNTALKHIIEAGHQDLVNTRIPTSEYLSRLQRQSFFISLSGVSMPLCHSLYEALYFQCIPLVHVKLLQFIDPYLSEILSPYSWSSLDNLCTFLERLNELESDALEKTRSQIKAYWNLHLSPNEIASRIREAQEVFICAEEKSVSFLVE